MQARLLRKDELTPAEIKYGRAPRPDPSVKYQPDVVLVAGGPGIIKSVSPDGLTWRIDAKTDPSGDIQIGKIAFITGRCVGRVLSESRVGNDLSLVLGPVDITEIFQKFEVSLRQPIDLAQALEYPLPKIPGMQLDENGTEVPSPDWSNASSASGLPAGSSAILPAGLRLPPRHFQSQGIIPQKLPFTFHTRPLNNADGLGAELRHEGQGVRVVAQMQLRLEKPSLDFYLSINNGTVNARVILHNAAALRVAFDGAVSDQFSGNVNWYAPAPGELSIPVAGPVPLSVNLRQQIWVRAAFSSRQSAFTAGGVYGLNGDIGFTVQNGKFSVIGPRGFTVQQSLMQNMETISLGPTGVVLSHVATITAGLGAWGFTTGPTADIGTSVGIAMGGNTGIVQCRAATLAMHIRGGVGWTIPRVVADFVNFFLKIVRAKQINDHGGIHSAWFRLFSQQAQTESKICGTLPGG